MSELRRIKNLLISKAQFNELYLESYENFKKEVFYYAENPELLKQKVCTEHASLQKQWRIQGIAPMPKPDPERYYSMLYLGLKNYPERLFNYVIAQSQKRALVLHYLPIRLDIEPNTHCNFRCKMCQVSKWDNHTRAPNMMYDDFKTFIDAQYGLCEVKLQGMGEPLLHPNFIDMISYLSSRSIWVRTTINGSLLHINNNAEKLLNSGVGEVQVSFDGANAEVFESIRIGSDFNRVLTNLTNFNTEANKRGLLISRMWVLLQKHNRSQILDFISLAKKMQFLRLTFSVGLGNWGQKEWHDVNSSLQCEPLSVSEQEMLLELGNKEGIEITFWDLKAKYSMSGIDTICGWPFNWSYVGCDFRVAPCCMIGNPDIIELGSGLDFAGIWNSKDYQFFRENHINGNIPVQCRNCYKDL